MISTLRFFGIKNMYTRDEEYKMGDFNFSKGSVLVVGDIMLDVYYFGGVSRISPEAPVPIVKIADKKNTLGGAANTIKNIASLGAKSYLIGTVGKDNNKIILNNLLNNMNIEAILIDVDTPTITKTRIISANQQILRLDFEEVKKINNNITTKIKNGVERFIRKVQAVVISDYGKGMCTFGLCQYLINRANELKIPIVIDPKGQDWRKYKGSTILTPNIGELSEVVGKNVLNNDKDIENYGLKILDKFDLKYLVVTRSEKGISLISRKEIYHFEAKAKEVFDISGAGDTVVGTLSVLLANDFNLIEAVKYANSAAGIVVSKFGTAPITYEEFLDILNGNDNSKIVSINKLLRIVDDLRSKGKRIIFTNGCFDILHKGHIIYMKEAKKLGGILIVGMNSDNSTRRLKGKDRPINNQESRAAVLASLEFVDYVVIFDEDTPFNLIKAIKPDVLVKGGDYKIKEIVGREFAKEVKIIPFVKDYSTSNIIKVIKNKGKEEKK